MKYSIIIPAHNAEDRISNALESIKEQSYTDYELIVVCDSCNDRTAEVARKTGAVVDEVEYGNDGLSRSRGLDLAQGDWVLFLDDDDWWLHEFVLELIDNEITDDIDILACSFIWSGMRYATPRSNGGRLYPSVWNKCWRRSFIGSTRFPNVYPDSDACFHVEMMAKNPRVKEVDIPIYFYQYLRPGSISERMGRSVAAANAYWS